MARSTSPALVAVVALSLGCSSAEGPRACGGEPVSFSTRTPSSLPTIEAAGGPFDEPVEVSTVEIVDGALTLRVARPDAEETITVPGVDTAPSLRSGDHVQVEVVPGRHVAIHDHAGLVAAYVRVVAFGSVQSELDWLETQSGVALTALWRCQWNGHGQCGRSSVAYDVAAGDARIEPGGEAPISDALVLRSTLAVDDADWWADDQCLIAVQGRVLLDVVRR